MGMEARGSREQGEVTACQAELSGSHLARSLKVQSVPVLPQTWRRHPRGGRGLLAEPQESPCKGLGTNREGSDELTQGLPAGESNTA